MIFEWAIARGLDITATESRALAKAHYEFWLAGGMQIDVFNLNRALELYEKVLENAEYRSESKIWMEYCQVSNNFQLQLSIILYFHLLGASIFRSNGSCNNRRNVNVIEF